MGGNWVVSPLLRKSQVSISQLRWLWIGGSNRICVIASLMVAQLRTLVVPGSSLQSKFCGCSLICLFFCIMEQALADIVHADCVAKERNGVFENRVLALLEKLEVAHVAHVVVGAFGAQLLPMLRSLMLSMSRASGRIWCLACLTKLPVL